jgi:hypothetical protein
MQNLRDRLQVAEESLAQEAAAGRSFAAQPDPQQEAKKESGGGGGGRSSDSVGGGGRGGVGGGGAGGRAGGGGRGGSKKAKKVGKGSKGGGASKGADSGSNHSDSLGSGRQLSANQPVSDEGSGGAGGESREGSYTGDGGASLVRVKMESYVLELQMMMCKGLVRLLAGLDAADRLKRPPRRGSWVLGFNVNVFSVLCTVGSVTRCTLQRLCPLHY